MARSRRSWAWLFWLILVLSAVKLYLYLFAGAVFLIWIAKWLIWLMTIVWLFVIVALWRILIQGESWGLLWRWIIAVIVLIGIGFATNSASWTGRWQWRSVGGATNVQVVGTTDQGENLIACESDPNAAVQPAPSGMTVAMFSTSYVPRADGKSPDYAETTGYSVTEFSYDKLNTTHSDSSVAYTTAEIPEGDVFFTVRGEPGFSAGYDFEMQVCSTDGKMLAKEALGAGDPRSADSANNVTGIIQYLWRNRRVWGPGQYRAYGYIFDKDNQWKLVAKSEVFTVK